MYFCNSIFVSMPFQMSVHLENGIFLHCFKHLVFPVLCLYPHVLPSSFTRKSSLFSCSSPLINLKVMVFGDVHYTRVVWVIIPSYALCVVTGCRKGTVAQWAVWVMNEFPWSVYNGIQTVECSVEIIDIGNESLQCSDRFCYCTWRI